jgi:bifunctional ADP-heptose synthase (sugar kinase/adenylyltransferase)
MTELNNIQQQKKLKILILGDSCIDEYHYGIVDRISPEAPVPIFVPTNKKIMPGMAANVAENLSVLGCKTINYFGNNSIKTRLIDEKSNQQILRIDNDQQSDPLIFDKIPKIDVDAIVISDYNKGTISYELIRNFRKEYSCPIFIDTKKNDLRKFDGCIVKINEKEYNARKSMNDNCIVTLGKRGAMQIQNNNKVEYSVPQIDVVDVCGAGDTFLASLAFSYLNTENFEDSINFALKASTVTIKKIGVYAPSLREINEIIG